MMHTQRQSILIFHDELHTVSYLCSYHTTLLSYLLMLVLTRHTTTGIDLLGFQKPGTLLRLFILTTNIVVVYTLQ